MKNIYLFILLVIISHFNALCQKHNKWIDLFNRKNLDGWDTYLAFELDSAGNKVSQMHVGLNKDPKNVFSVVKSDGENVIRISGETWGGISTQKVFMNYHLQLKFRWGQLTWGKKKNQKKDSGLLYHADGEHGANNGPWMRSQEFQIEQGNVGDYWGVAGAMQDIPAIKIDNKTYAYNPAGSLITFSVSSPAGRRCLKSLDAELPTGEWNTLDLYCFGNRSVHVVNGKVLMVLFNSAKLDNKQILPLKKGKIQLQSEGAELFYKEIKLKKIKAIPANILKGL